MSKVLAPELERFAETRVAEGGYKDVDAVVRSAFDLLRERDEARAAFIQSLRDAEADADQNGSVSIEEIMADFDEALVEKT